MRPELWQVIVAALGVVAAGLGLVQQFKRRADKALVQSQSEEHKAGAYAKRSQALMHELSEVWKRLDEYGNRITQLQEHERRTDEHLMVHSGWDWDRQEQLRGLGEQFPPPPPLRPPTHHHDDD